MAMSHAETSAQLRICINQCKIITIMESAKETKKGNKKADIILFIIITVLTVLLILGIKSIWI